MRFAAYLSLILSVTTVLLLSTNGAYYFHLYPDIYVFYDRANYFINHFNLTNLGHNEYQPGAILFFILLSPILLLSNNLETFKIALFFANTILIFLIAYLLQRSNRTEGIFLLSLILLFTGPIVLFRFDLFVTLLSILSFYFWKKNHPITSVLILAFATTVKVYPIIFLPYLLFLDYKNKGWKTTLSLFLIFIGSLINYLLFYSLIFRINLLDSLASLNYHNLKSVGTESVWATVIMVINYLNTNSFLPMESDYGINAIQRNVLPLPLWFFNNVWIIPVILLHLWLFLKYQKRHPRFDIRFILLNLLSFLIFSKVLANQYLIWLFFMVPLIPASILLKKHWQLNIFIILLSLLLHLYIFPLNYSNWLQGFQSGKQDLFLFLVNTYGNLLLVLLFISMFLELILEKTDD